MCYLHAWVRQWGPRITCVIKYSMHWVGWMQEKKISILSALKNSKCVKMFFVKTHEHQICIFLSYLRQNSHQDPLRCMGLKPKYESRDLLKKKKTTPHNKKNNKNPWTNKPQKSPNQQQQNTHPKTKTPNMELYWEQNPENFMVWKWALIICFLINNWLIYHKCKLYKEMYVWRWSCSFSLE